MTEKTKAKAAATDAEITAGAFAPEGIVETLKSAQEKVQAMQIPTAVRDFVKKNAETAKTRVADVEQGALNATATVEKAIVAVVGAGASLTRGVIDATIANVNLTLDGVRSVADASSPQDAAKRYVDFLKEFGQANASRAQDAFNTVRQAATDGARAVQAEVGRYASFGSKAA